MVTTGEQLPYQGQILVSNSPVSNSPYPNYLIWRMVIVSSVIRSSITGSIIANSSTIDTSISSNYPPCHRIRSHNPGVSLLLGNSLVLFSTI